MFRARAAETEHALIATYELSEQSMEDMLHPRVLPQPKPDPRGWTRSGTASTSRFHSDVIIAQQLAASAMSRVGPSRHFAAKQRFGRFRKEADIKWQVGPASSVANDPKHLPAIFADTAGTK